MYPFYSLHVFLSYDFNGFIGERVHESLVVTDLGADPQSSSRAALCGLESLMRTLPFCRSHLNQTHGPMLALVFGKP